MTIAGTPQMSADITQQARLATLRGRFSLAREIPDATMIVPRSAADVECP